MEKLQLIHQLFIGKVADEIGVEKTIQLLKEAKEAFDIPVVSQNSKLLDLLTEIANSDTLYSNTRHRMIARKLLKSNFV